MPVILRPTAVVWARVIWAKWGDVGVVVTDEVEEIGDCDSACD